MDVPEAELQDLYTWVDEIPLSRPKKNIARDFSDGVMAAEAVLHFFPKAVELHNYSAANSVSQKMYNWNTLNAKDLFDRSLHGLSMSARTHASQASWAKALCKHRDTCSGRAVHATHLPSARASHFNNLQVFSKLGFAISQADCEAVVKCAPMAAERVLNLMRHTFEELAASGGELRDEKPSGPRPPNEYSSYKIAAHGDAPAAAIKAGAYETPHGRNMQQEQTIRELKEMNEILETKTRKLEQLVRLKDAKIQTLLAKLNTLEASVPPHH